MRSVTGEALRFRPRIGHFGQQGVGAVRDSGRDGQLADLQRRADAAGAASAASVGTYDEIVHDNTVCARRSAARCSDSSTG